MWTLDVPNGTKMQCHDTADVFIFNGDKWIKNGNHKNHICISAVFKIKTYEEVEKHLKTYEEVENESVSLPSKKVKAKKEPSKYNIYMKNMLLSDCFSELSGNNRMREIAKMWKYSKNQ